MLTHNDAPKSSPRPDAVAVPVIGVAVPRGLTSSGAWIRDGRSSPCGALCREREGRA